MLKILLCKFNQRFFSKCELFISKQLFRIYRQIKKTNKPDCVVINVASAKLHSSKKFMPFLNRFGESIKLRYLQKSSGGKIFLSRQDRFRVITWQKLTRGRLYCKINMPPDLTIISVCFTYIQFSFFQSRLNQKVCHNK